MPLHPDSERAANTVAAELLKLDRAIIDHIVDGDTLPTVAAVMAPIVKAITRSTESALKQIGAVLTTRMVNDATAEIVAPIREAVAAALAEAKRVRRRMPRTPPAEPKDDDGTIAGLIKKAGAGAALLLLISRRKKRDRTTDLVRQVARQVGLRPPRPLASYGKMVARTQTAIVRNDVAAKMVDDANDAVAKTVDKAKGDTAKGQQWALFIRDGRNGPTDHECERVDSRWATSAWLRKHRVQHPNCTRIGYPRVLPAGARITLLS
jgi:hypothetical protein